MPQLSIRFTAKQVEMIDAVVEMDGWKDRAEYMRYIIIADVKSMMNEWESLPARSAPSPDAGDSGAETPDGGKASVEIEGARVTPAFAELLDLAAREL